MDIVIDIQGFRDANAKFIPKEVAIIALDAPFVGHWIMMPPYSFGDLPRNVRHENNWLTRNYHDIEWFDGEANPKYFTSQLREITRQARHIYVRGAEKETYLRNLLSRNIYNLEDISPAFKNLSEGEVRGRYCGYHGFRKFGIFHCALRNAYKLKYWLIERNNIVYGNTKVSTQATCGSPDNWSLNVCDDDDDDDDDDDEDEEISSAYEISRDRNEIEKKNLQKSERSIEKEEEKFEKSELSSSLDRDKLEATTNSTQTDIENSALQVGTIKDALPKEVNTEVIEYIIPLVRSPPCQNNELSRNSTSITSHQCQACGSLSSRQSPEGVDEVDSHRR
ncbi:uncharacterized protein [Polyergus mexicanus]|uniref:uncharacterized protein n=1 Tax=Polyergus mexicanus TaxID=615972 RepID=UPI0038B4AF1C